MRIGQVAAKVGVARSALRFYEAAGLLTPTERTAAGYRMCGPEAVARIRFIQRASALGLTRAETAELTSRSGELRRVEARLQMQPLPDYCHLGDCNCWFAEAC